MSTPKNLKELTMYKKKLNWGELHPFFHLVSNSLVDLESLHVHGFDHPAKRLINKKNWNLPVLGGGIDDEGKIKVKHGPKVLIERRFHEQNYEIFCLALLEDEPLYQYHQGGEMGFIVWDPSSMSNIVRLPKFAEFIRHAYQSGDEADKMLVEYAAKTVNNVMKVIESQLQVVQVRGHTIAEAIKLVANGE